MDQFELWMLATVFNPWPHKSVSLIAKIEKAMAPHSSTLAWKIPWMEEPGGLQSMGLRTVNMTEQLHFHFSLSCTGERNGNPLQCSCLENPRDGGAWWAAVYGVAQSRTWLKWLSSNCKNGLPSGSVLKHLPATQEMQVPCLGWKDPLEEMATHSRILGKFHGQRSLTGYSPWSRKQSDMT